MSEQVNRANEVQPSAKPQLFVKSLTFNDGTSLNLTPNSIVVFTGANNSGKSQVLKDLERFPDEDLRSGTIVVKDCEYDYRGDIDEKVFFDRHFKITDDGYYYCDEANGGFSRSTLTNFWERKCLTSGLRFLFVKRLSTEFRLTAANALNRNDNPERHPIYKLNKSEALAQRVSDYFRQAFGTDLVVNRREMRTIPLHVGQAPDKTAYTIKNEDEYYEKVSALPRLDDQGDGMRSFASILLDTFTTEHSICIAIFIAFSSGTSWGTFAILVPIVVNMFSETDPTMMIVAVSAVLAGAVCGDHISPISDTTIMSSSGAQSNHINHVQTQMQYAMVVVAACVPGYLIAGFTENWLITLVSSLAILTAALLYLRRRSLAEDARA